MRLPTRSAAPTTPRKIAAIRETIEESAVLAGLRSPGAVDPALGPILQDALLGGAASPPCSPSTASRSTSTR